LLKINSTLFVKETMEKLRKINLKLFVEEKMEKVAEKT